MSTLAEFYDKIITTRLAGSHRHPGACARRGIKVCCGGIIGMGEQVEIALACWCCSLISKAIRERADQSLERGQACGERYRERPDPIELVRLIAVARILMPKSVVRLSAGRQYMSTSCRRYALAGANRSSSASAVTTKNPEAQRDADSWTDSASSRGFWLIDIG